jgi:hypothetical protein
MKDQNDDRHASRQRLRSRPRVESHYSDANPRPFMAKGPKACNAFGSRCAAKRSSSTPRRVAIALAWPYRRADAVFLASRVDMICGKRGLAGLVALTNPTGGTCKTPNRPSGVQIQCTFSGRSWRVDLHQVPHLLGQNADRGTSLLSDCRIVVNSHVAATRPGACFRPIGIFAAIPVVVLFCGGHFASDFRGLGSWLRPWI